MLQSITKNRLFSQVARKPETLGITSDWRDRPSPGPIPSSDWDHNLAVDREVAQYLLWRYRNTCCTLHNMCIEPEGAKVFWLRRGNIRPTDRKHSGAIAREMKQGRFEYIADTLRLDTDMKIVDAHHRLLACIFSRQSFRTNIAFGLSPHTRRIVDTGQKKRGADFVLRSLGVPNYSAASTICRDAIACIRNDSFDRTTCRTTETEIESFYMAHSEAINQAVQLAHRMEDGFQVSTIGSIFFFLVKAGQRQWLDRTIEMIYGRRPICFDAACALARRVWLHRSNAPGHNLDCNRMRRAFLAANHFDQTIEYHDMNPLEDQDIDWLGTRLDGQSPSEVLGQ